MIAAIYTQCPKDKSYQFIAAFNTLEDDAAEWVIKIKEKYEARNCQVYIRDFSSLGQFKTFAEFWKNIK